MARSTIVQEYQQTTAFQPGASIPLTQNASTLVVSANTARFQIWISNPSSSIVYLQLAATGAGSGKGIMLSANSQIYFNTYIGAISAFTAGSGVALAIAEI